MAQYADQYYEYNADRRVTKSVVQAGLLTYLFSYTTSGNTEDPNHWDLLITETRPDGSQLAHYVNFLGQTLLTDLSNGTDHWVEYYQYDSNYQETLHAMPSAVVSYDATNPNLGVVLQTNAGLIRQTTYYTTTTATETTPGSAAGYEESQQLLNGIDTLTPVPISQTSYYQHAAAVAVTYPVAESTVYSDYSGMVSITTSFAYTWYTGTSQPQQRTTTLPVVPTIQNGNGATDTITEIYDQYGNLNWQRDQRGFDHLLSARSADRGRYSANPRRGWHESDASHGLDNTRRGGLNIDPHDYEVDVLGRTIQSLGPTHDVLGQVARTASWMVYRDLEDETYSGQGYALGIGPEYAYTLINPVSIQRANRTTVAGRIRSSPCGGALWKNPAIVNSLRGASGKFRSAYGGRLFPAGPLGAVVHPAIQQSIATCLQPTLLLHSGVRDRETGRQLRRDPVRLRHHESAESRRQSQWHDQSNHL